MQPMSVDDAIRILGQRRAGRSRKGKFVGNRRIMATEEETNAALLKRLKVLAIRQGIITRPTPRPWRGKGQAEGGAVDD